MHFKFLVRAANRLFFSLLLLVTCISVRAQIEDSSSLIHRSEKVLQKKVTVQWQGGSLLDFLQQLSRDHQLEISYATGRIKGQRIRGFSVALVSLEKLLSNALDTTQYQYALVADIIVVIKSEKIRTTVDTVSTQPSSSISPRIFVPSSYKKASAYELKILEEIYSEEIKKAAKSRKKANQESDTTTSKKKRYHKPKVIYRRPLSNNLFVKGSFGYSVNNLRFSNLLSSDWMTEVGWQSTISDSYMGQIEIGIKLKRWLFSTGVGMQQFKIEQSWQETVRYGPPDYPAPPRFEKVTHTSSERYQAISFPLTVGYMQQLKKWQLGLGAGALLHYYSSNKGSSQFLASYYATNFTVPYQETYTTFSTALHGRALVGYQFSPTLTLAAEAEYQLGLQTFYENSLYSQKISALQLKISLFVWLCRF